MPDGLYRVVLPYAVYGVEVKGGLIFDAAPIAKWSVRSDLESFKQWVEGKGGTVEPVVTLLPMSPDGIQRCTGDGEEHCVCPT